jgi:YD repeat-containing protein
MTKKWKLSLLRILLLASPVYVASVAGGATLDIDTGDPLDCPPSNLFWWSNERGSSFYCIDPRDDGPCDGKGQNGETTGSVSTGCCGASAEKGKEECDTCRDPEAGGGSGTNGEDPADSSTEAGRRIDKDQSCRDCPEAGMPLWSVEEPLLSVRLVDVPMWYKPAFGPKMALKLHYKSLEGSFGHADTRQANIFGFGPGWSTPWRSYIRARDGSSPAEVWVFDGVGNVRSYLVGSPGANAPNYHEKTGAFVETDTVGYVLTHNNGAKDFYAEEVENNSSGAGNGEKIYFLSRREDAVGRGLTFNYSSVTNGGFDQMRLTNIVDAAGLSTTFTYTNVGPMNSLIHKVTNPHGFAAMMLYDANGRLETVVDTISLTSKFVYDGSDRITSVKTPYGTNRFEYVSLSDTNCLAVRVIEKEVRKHLFVFGDLPVDPWPNVADVITSLNNYMDMATNVLATTDFFYKLLDDLKGRDPAAFTNHPSARCSAYWGPLQYQNLTNTIDSSLNNSTFAINSVTTNSYNLAHVTRWRRAWGGFISNTKSFERLPGANINGTEVGPFVFYAYDMGASHLEGTKEGFDNLPAQIFRETMLTDPTDPSLRVWDATQIEYYGVGTVRPGYVKKKMVLERNDFPEPALGIPQFCFRIHRPIRPLTGCSGSGCNRYASGVIQDENEFTCMGVSSYSTNWLASLSGTDGRYIEIVAFPWDASTGGGIGGPGGAPIHYEYHGTNKELSKVTYDGIVEKIRAFNAAGQLQSEKFQQTTGGVTVILWTNSWTYLNGFVRTNIDPRGLAVAYDTDPMGRITKIGFPDSTYVSNRYDRLDLVETIDRNGFSTRYVYDAFRKLLYMTNAMTNVVSFGYCNCGSLSSVTDGNGQVTSYTYDNRGRKTQVTFPGGSWVATKFDAWSHPTNLTTSGGIEQGILYNLKGQVREKWLKSGASWKCIQANLYDSLGRLTTTTNASGLALNLEYDDYDRVTKMIYPDTTFDARAYTTNGILAVTDAAGNSTTYGYDIWGRPMSISSPLGDTVTYGLTPAGDLTSLKNESQAVTQWIYDQYGRVSRKLDATGKTNFVYTYDPGGRLTNQTVPSITASAFVSTTYAYDKVGNVTNIVYPTAGQNVGLAYDKNNRLVTMKDPLGTTAWSYTTFGKLASEDGPWSDDTVGYSYGGDRKVQSMSVSQEGGSAWSQGYTYDGFGRLDKITNPVGTFDYEWTGVSSGDWLGSLVKKLDLPFSNVRTNSYDSMGAPHHHGCVVRQHSAGFVQLRVRQCEPDHTHESECE